VHRSPWLCWANQCGVANFCCDCPRLYKPMPASAAIIPLAGNDSGRKVIVGLGNPGSSYENTPHNAGYRVLDRMATRMNGLWVSFAEGAVCEVDIAGETVSLFKPAAQMNHSGPSTRQFLDRMGTAINDCLVVHDEMDLTLGQVKLKQGGGDAGHKGLKSLVASLGSHEFKRMRIGVRRPDNTNAAKNSVLQPFSDSDETALEPSVDRAVDILLNDVAGSAL